MFLGKPDEDVYGWRDEVGGGYKWMDESENNRLKLGLSGIDRSVIPATQEAEAES